MNTGGIVAITSPVVASYIIGVPAKGTGFTNQLSISIPDGMEFPAGSGIGVSMTGYSSSGVATAVGYGQIQINGYEY